MESVSMKNDASRASVRALASDLKNHDDTEKQISALQERVEKTKERARKMVELIEARIAYIAEEWGVVFEQQNTTAGRQLEAVGGKSQKGVTGRPPITSGQMAGINEEMLQVKDKIEKLAEIEKLTRTLHRKASQDTANVRTANEKTSDGCASPALKNGEIKLVSELPGLDVVDSIVSSKKLTSVVFDSCPSPSLKNGEIKLVSELPGPDIVDSIITSKRLARKVSESCASPALKNGEIKLVSEMPGPEIVDSIVSSKKLAVTANSDSSPTLHL